MKSRIIPVILTAALTSMGTLFFAARFNSNNPLFSANTSGQLPVNYAGLGDKSVVGSPGTELEFAL